MYNMKYFLILPQSSLPICLPDDDKNFPSRAKRIITAERNSTVEQMGLVIVLMSFDTGFNMINRPGVAGAVLQTPPLLIN